MLKTIPGCHFLKNKNTKLHAFFVLKNAKNHLNLLQKALVIKSFNFFAFTNMIRFGFVLQLFL